jgi:hypothetical protein
MSNGETPCGVSPHCQQFASSPWRRLAAIHEGPSVAPKRWRSWLAAAAPRRAAAARVGQATGRYSVVWPILSAPPRARGERLVPRSKPASRLSEPSMRHMCRGWRARLASMSGAQGGVRTAAAIGAWPARAGEWPPRANFRVLRWLNGRLQVRGEWRFTLRVASEPAGRRPPPPITAACCPHP